ncbi:MAG: SusC/RagA family TonB-linked outer membrane protein, partial [Spirosomataceae bacterium]
MKLTLLLILVAIIQVNATVYSQTVRLNVKNSGLEKIFLEIRSQTGYDFLYNSRLLKGTVPVTIQMNGATLEEILDEVFRNQPITYSIIEKTIVVKKKSLWHRGNSDRQLLNEGKKAQMSSPADSGPKLKIDHMLPPIRHGESLFQNVRGKVTDEKGDPLPGVNILVKGTQQGTTTDGSGNFALNVPNEEAVLVFSFVGYRSVELRVGSQTEINVALEIDEKGLEEVVVVGFGAQKKVNLTGAVATVNSEDLERRTVTKASQALQGQMSGISVRQTSGNPSGNSASIIIRGQGTFSAAGNSPLVLVDGIESSIDAVDPADIESVSVLKDAASAAIFGSKAANGVILIETKKGVTGKPVINYNMYVGKSTPTMLPEMINSWEYAEVVNDAYLYSGQQPRYTEAEIQKFRDGSDPINYPNFDHIGYLFKSGSGVETKHDISMRGGTEQTQYMFSTGYYKQNGIITRNNADRYNIRLNLDTKLYDNLKLSVRLAGIKTGSKEPSGAYAPGLGGIVSGAMRNSNALHGPTPDGFFSRNETLHPEADLNSKSFVQNRSTNIYANGSLTWNPIKDLKIV